MSFETDAKSYSGVDSGCLAATQHLNHQSECKTCPFPECLYDIGGNSSRLKTQRNKEVNKLFNEGKSMEELALMFKVSQRTIRRALKR